MGGCPDTVFTPLKYATAIYNIVRKIKQDIAQRSIHGLRSYKNRVSTININYFLLLFIVRKPNSIFSVE